MYWRWLWCDFFFNENIFLFKYFSKSWFCEGLFFEARIMWITVHCVVVLFWSCVNMVLGVGSLSCLYRWIIVCCQRHFITVDSFEVFALSYGQFFKDILLALQSCIWSKLLDLRSLVWQLIDGQRDYFGRCDLVFIWRF